MVTQNMLRKCEVKRDFFHDFCPPFCQLSSTVPAAQWCQIKQKFNYLSLLLSSALTMVRILDGNALSNAHVFRVI